MTLPRRGRRSVVATGLLCLVACGAPPPKDDGPPGWDPRPDVAGLEVAADAAPDDARSAPDALVAVPPRDGAVGDADAASPPPDAPAPADPLAGRYGAAEVRWLVRQTYAAATPPVADFETPAAPTRCFYYPASREVRAYVYACDGCPMLLQARVSEAGALVLTREVPSPPDRLADARVARGAAYAAADGVARQSFHIQFRVPEGTRPALGGIPGRTVDPAYGDLWLLGCPLAAP